MSLKAVKRVQTASAIFKYRIYKFKILFETSTTYFFFVKFVIALITYNFFVKQKSSLNFHLKLVEIYLNPIAAKKIFTFAVKR